MDLARLRRRLRRAAPAAYDDGRLRITRTGRPPVVAIAGVINEHTRSGLTGTLGQLAAGHREVHISLRDVACCELAGLRTIIGLTGVAIGARDDPARQVVLHEVPEQLTNILQILGWDATPGLVIASPARRRTLTPLPQPAPLAARRPGTRALALARPIIMSRSVTAGQRTGSDRRGR